MENIIILGKITATSKKSDGKFKQETPTKTAYVEAKDRIEKEKLVKFGLREYTSAADGNNFFIIKLPQNVAVYVGESDEPFDIDGSTETANFKTADHIYTAINIIKGEKDGNEFYRLQAIMVSDSSQIEMIEKQNPFAEFNKTRK